MSETRKLTAILVSDVVGYSRFAGRTKIASLARLRTLRSDLIDPTIAVHHGRIVKRTGDGSVIEFRSVVDAVRCAIELQNAIVERNAGVPENRRIEFRVGIHVGDVVEESDGDLMGDGVNVAARLESIAKPGAICLSEQAYRQVKGRLDLTVTDLGPTELKNIAQPIHVYSLQVGDARAGEAGETRDARDARRAHAEEAAARARAVAAALAAVLIVFAGGAWWFPHANRPRTASLRRRPPTPHDFRSSCCRSPICRRSGAGLFCRRHYGRSHRLTSRIRDTFVIARNTAMTFKGKPIDAKAIGKDLGVRYVLEGCGTPSGDKMTVNAQLIATADGAHVWADRFDGERSKLGELQVEVVARLANSLGLELVKAEVLRSLRERPSNPDAVDLAMQAEEKYNLPASKVTFKTTFDDPVTLSERALALDPQNVRALTVLAGTLVRRMIDGSSDDPAGDIARADRDPPTPLWPFSLTIHWFIT